MVDMRHRAFGRAAYPTSVIGYGMWGMGGWTGSDDRESLASLDLAVKLGCNFFDTAWVYGTGRSERLLGEILGMHRDQPLYVATKVPPKNMKWPARNEDAASDTYPADHIRAFTEKSLENLGIATIDLLQLHVWSDSWADDEGWQRAADDLKRQGLIRAFGISANRWEPANGMRALQTGLVDSVQVVYNIFDQSAADELFPFCQERNIAVIARVPLDEGGLTGTLTKDSHWPEGDWRNSYFTPERLAATLERVERLRPLVPDGMDLSELALRFVLEHPAVSTTIPGMRTTRHVERNLSAGDGERLPPRLLDALRMHRWDRAPTPV
jgi:aryl-alcohol dehydrogenase-like predicted oxidoreductase